MLTHRNLVINAANIVVAVGYGSDSIYLHAPPMFHLADNASTLAVTMLGGVHVFIPRFDPAAVVAAIEAERVTNTLLVPTMINALVNYPGLDAHDLSTLTMVPFGASPMPDAVLARATEKLPRLPLPARLRDDRGGAAGHRAGTAATRWCPGAAEAAARRR